MSKTKKPAAVTPPAEEKNNEVKNMWIENYNNETMTKGRILNKFNENITQVNMAERYINILMGEMIERIGEDDAKNHKYYKFLEGELELVKNYKVIEGIKTV